MAGAQGIAQALPCLTSLNLADTSTSSASLPAIAGLRKLQELNLSHSAVNDEPVRLRAHLKL